jgi:hypothetical protein
VSGGQSITGKRSRRKLKSDSIREHLYYRCASNHPGEDHPTVRWKSVDLEEAIANDPARMRRTTSCAVQTTPSAGNFSTRCV